MLNLPDSLQNLNLERSILSGFIKYPDSLINLNNISEKDFSHPIHSTVFCLIRNIIFDGKKVEIPLISQKLIDLQIRTFGDINIHQYLEDISFIQISLKGIEEISKELTRLRIRRELHEKFQEAQEYVKSVGNDIPTEEIISHTDSIYNKLINEYEFKDVPSDIFAEAESIINDRVNNADKIISVPTPFKIFNDMFGPIRIGITAICGRAKGNKSTILLNIGFGSILQNENLHVLYLDTELKKYDHIFRSMAAFSQVNANYLDDGTWIKNKELSKRVNSSWDTVQKLKGRFHHHYIGNRSIEEVINVIKRWYFMTCKRNGRGLVILDYIKIGNEKLSNYNAEHQELGRKINALNAISQQLSLPILSSMQLNRSAIIDQREDESTISMTDRLSWFANGVFIFRKKRADEISEEGPNFGTHKLIPVVLRYEGKNTQLLDLVRMVNTHGKTVYKQNFVNYNFSNFLLEERGTLRDIVIQQQLNANLQTPNNQQNEVEI